jgi:hypothetical protein
MIKEICNAAGKFARFPTPFSSVVPGLFVADNHTDETHSVASGAATSPGRCGRGRLAGSGWRAAGFCAIGTSAIRRNASDDGDRSLAATRIALRPHDPGTGEEIDRREVVKGYEYSRGEFVTFTAEELKALDVESSKVIDFERPG